MQSFNDIMANMNAWLIEHLGEWVLTYHGLFLILAAFLLLVLIIVIICVAACHAKNKKEKARLKAEVEKARAESANSVGTDNSDGMTEPGYDGESVELLRERCHQMSLAIDDLNGTVTKQNATIEEQRQTIQDLSARLENTSAAPVYGDTSDDFGTQVDGASERIEELDRLNRDLDDENTELRHLNAELHGENDDLLSENDELKKANAELNAEIRRLKDRQAELAARPVRRETTAASDGDTRSAARPAAARTTTRQPAADTARTPVHTGTPDKRHETVPEPDEQDDEDEYYDEYGDENSAVKVTLKFDRAKGNWIILRSDTDRTYRRLATKQEALIIAKDLARRLHAQLVVHKKDGKFQRI